VPGLPEDIATALATQHFQQHGRAAPWLDRVQPLDPGVNHPLYPYMSTLNHFVTQDFRRSGEGVSHSGTASRRASWLSDALRLRESPCLEFDLMAHKRIWTAAKDSELIAFHDSGLSYAGIASELDVTTNDAAAS
jgi:hypothetical protein